MPLYIKVRVDKSINSARVMPSNQRSDFPFLPCLWLKTRFFKIKSNLVNADTLGALESVYINGMSVLSGYSLEEI